MPAASYVFYCDADGVEFTDTLHETVAAANGPGRVFGSFVVVMLDRVFVDVDELGEDATECVEVSLCEGIDEVVLDAFFVWWPYLFEACSTLASEGDVEPPSVVRVEVPANEPVVFHAIKHAGEAAATERVAQQHRGRELLQGETAVGHPGKVHQDVELLDAQMERREVAPEAVHDQRVRPLQLAPHGKLFRAQFGHPASILCPNDDI
jgi:hypothetical protein